MEAPEDINVLPGMSASVEVRLRPGAAAADSWLIPADSLFVDEAGDTYVWRVAPDDLSVQRVPVSAGDLRDDRVTILSGLSAGDEIVTAGVRLLTEGMRIRRMDEGAG
jgi:multidrug efflux pump subunit AcrA (membrane-fusion protein)